MITNYTTMKYIDSTKSNAGYLLGQQILSFMGEHFTPGRTIVILCIGTDRATGDCLGPLVGEHLYHRIRLFGKAFPCQLYGTLETPVHAVNLEDTITNIYAQHDDPYIIAVDAALGTNAHVGYITVSPYAIVPGKGVNKKLPAIGDLSITGIVNLSGMSGSALLQSTRLNTVMKLSRTIASGIICGLHTLETTSSLPYTPQSHPLPCQHFPLP